MELINISNFSQVSSANVIDQIIIGAFESVFLIKPPCDVTVLLYSIFRHPFSLPSNPLQKEPAPIDKTGSFIPAGSAPRFRIRSPMTAGCRLNILRVLHCRLRCVSGLRSGTIPAIQLYSASAETPGWGLLP